MSANPRKVALDVLLALSKGQSLSSSLNPQLNKISDKRDRGFAQTLIYSSLRNFYFYEALIAQLVKKPLRAKDKDVHLLLLLALVQIQELQTPDHAAVAESLKLAQKLKKNWAKGLLNGVLRNYLRNPEKYLQAIKQTDETLYNHPQWLVNKIKQAYPEDYAKILQANNQQPPLTLRVNSLVQTREEFLALLAAQDIAAKPHPCSGVGVVLEESQEIEALPSYEIGGFSVQDIAAQQAAQILQTQAGMQVLDACAAPGGKTSHLFEISHNQAEITAIEKDENRIERLEKNLDRLNFQAKIINADAADLDNWWDKQEFDQILLDAPCSGTGIIRRQPDIRLNRQKDDIKELEKTQQNLLQQLWKTLKPQGKLLYATCSILPQENSEQIAKFIKSTPDAELIPLELCGDRGLGELPLERGVADGETGCGTQILPGEQNLDGFYYALLTKKPS